MANGIVGPIDYRSLMQVEDPTTQLVRGLQAGTLIRQANEQAAAAEQARIMEQQYRADMELVRTDPTGRMALDMALKYPKAREPLQKFYEAKTQEQKDEIFSTGSQVFYALKDGDPERAKVAMELLDSRIAASENSGKDASYLKSIKASIERNPQDVVGTTSAMLANFDPDRWKRVLEAMAEQEKGPLELSKKKGEAYRDAMGWFAEDPTDERMAALGNRLLKFLPEEQVDAELRKIASLPEKSRMVYAKNMAVEAKDRNLQLGKGGVIFNPRTGETTVDPTAAAAAASEAAAGAPTTNISVGAEKKYGEALAGKIAETDMAWRDAAIKAPDTVDRARRVKGLLESGQVFTGAGAEWKLNFGRAAKAAGINLAGDAITNTERLAADLGQGTLDAIKFSGLGAGQGFTNTDREFLERVVTGKITFDENTLKRTADLAERAAVASIEKWNKRSKQIPASAVEGTGLDISPVEIPASKHSGKGKTESTGWTDEKERRYQELRRRLNAP